MNVPANQKQGGLPAAFDFSQAKPDAAFALPANAEVESLADGISQGYGIIGYKGKVWSLRIKGEKHMIVRPDDGTPASYIDVIVLRQARAKSKSYYSGGFEENASEGKQPDCASVDSIRPDPGVAFPQDNGTGCQMCPRNVFKTNEQGRKGKECSDYKRLAVLMLPNVTKALLGEPLLEPVFLRVPAASLNDLAVMGDNMAGQGWPYYSFILRISFDPAAAHPKFVFRPIQPLTTKEAPVVLPLREDPIAYRITGEDISAAAAGEIESNPKTALAAPTPSQAPQQADPRPAAPAPSLVKPPQAPPPAAAPSPKPAAPKPAAPAPKPPAPKPAAPPPPAPPPPAAVDEPIGDTGFGTAEVTAAAIDGEVIPPALGQAEQPADQFQGAGVEEAQTVGEGSDAEDTGDAGLDAEVAALLKQQ